MREIPYDYFLVGDNVYTVSNKMLIPFSRATKQRMYNCTYNFYLSQLRIRIEMAFERMSTKWRIFRRNLECSLQKNSTIIMVAAKLHNFVINNDKIGFQTANSLEDFDVQPLVDGPRSNNSGFLPSDPLEDEYINTIGVSSCRRVEILDEM